MLIPAATTYNPRQLLWQFWSTIPSISVTFKSNVTTPLRIVSLFSPSTNAHHRYVKGPVDFSIQAGAGLTGLFSFALYIQQVTFTGQLWFLSHQN